MQCVSDAIQYCIILFVPNASGGTILTDPTALHAQYHFWAV